MGYGLSASSSLRAAPSAHALLGAGYGVVVASVAIGSWQGWPDQTTRGLVELATAVLWLAAFRHWSRSGDAATTRFWKLMGWSALSLSGYGVAGGLADVTGTMWLNAIAGVSVLASIPLLVASIVSRSNRQEGSRAGASTVLDVAIIVLSVG